MTPNPPAALAGLWERKEDGSWFISIGGFLAFYGPLDDIIVAFAGPADAPARSDHATEGEAQAACETAYAAYRESVRAEAESLGFRVEEDDPSS